jgi:hypothetical protein
LQNLGPLSLGGGSIVESSHNGYNGSGFVNFPASGGFVEYQNVNGGSGGSRTLQFRFALGATGARTGSLIVNSSSQPIAFGPTGACGGVSRGAEDTTSLSQPTPL